MAQVRELTRLGALRLSESESPVLDAQLLLAGVLGVERVWIMTWDDKEVSPEHEAQYLALIERRQRGEPVAYLLGYKEF